MERQAGIDKGLDDLALVIGQGGKGNPHDHVIQVFVVHDPLYLHGDVGKGNQFMHTDDAAENKVVSGLQSPVFISSLVVLHAPFTDIEDRGWKRFFLVFMG